MSNEGKHRDVVYYGEENKRYGATYKLDNDQQIKCYSKKQLKILYPNKDYKLVAEYAPGSSKNPTGTLGYKKRKLNLSQLRTHSRVVYSEKGYLGVGEDSFVVLLKNATPTRIIAAVLCVLVIAAGVFLAVNLTGQSEIAMVEDEAIAAAGFEQNVQPELEEGAVDWEGAKPRETGGVTAGIAIPGYKSITIDAGETDIKVNLQNPEGNPCYFVISLILQDGTELYKSKMVEPGKGLYDITINNPLDKGEYPAVVKYETFSLNELNPLNGAEVKITLIAE